MTANVFNHEVAKLLNEQRRFNVSDIVEEIEDALNGERVYTDLDSYKDKTAIAEAIEGYSPDEIARFIWTVFKCVNGEFEGKI